MHKLFLHFFIFYFLKVFTSYYLLNVGDVEIKMFVIREAGNLMNLLKKLLVVSHWRKPELLALLRLVNRIYVSISIK